MLSRTVSIVLLGSALLVSTVDALPQRDLDSAAKQKKVVFLLVSEPSVVAETAQARAVVRDAMTQVKKSTLIELDRSDLGNAPLVTKFRLAGAPLPVILVVAPNGVIAGGIPARGATVERLVATVPSPKKTEILGFLQDGKSVFVVLGRSGMSTQAAAAVTCSAACTQMTDRAAVVQVDLDDLREAGFLSQLKVDRAATGPVTLVVNPQGQVTASIPGAPQVASLVEAATKKVGGCCPSTVQDGSKSCGPTK